MHLLGSILKGNAQIGILSYGLFHALANGCLKALDVNFDERNVAFNAFTPSKVVNAYKIDHASFLIVRQKRAKSAGDDAMVAMVRFVHPETRCAACFSDCFPESD